MNFDQVIEFLSNHVDLNNIEYDVKTDAIEVFQCLTNRLIESVKEDIKQQCVSAKRLKQEFCDLEAKHKPASKNTIVRFNVRGIYFATNVDNLHNESNYLSVLTGDHFKSSLDTQDNAFFIDRTSSVFGLILDHLAGNVINAALLDKNTLISLHHEAEFYAISSLTALTCPKFKTGSLMSPLFSCNNSVAEAYGVDCCAVSEKPFSFIHGCFDEKKVKLLVGQNNCKIGVVPLMYFSNKQKNWQDDDALMWMMSCKDGKIWSITDPWSKYCSWEACDETIVSVRLCSNGNLSFAINDKDMGIAFDDVTNEEPLFLCCELKDNAKIQIVY
jgi:hypothetical protein